MVSRAWCLLPLWLMAACVFPRDRMLVPRSPVTADVPSLAVRVEQVQVEAFEPGTLVARLTVTRGQGHLTDALLTSPAMPPCSHGVRATAFMIGGDVTWARPVSLREGGVFDIEFPGAAAAQQHAVGPAVLDLWMSDPAAPCVRVPLWDDRPAGQWKMTPRLGVGMAVNLVDPGASLGLGRWWGPFLVTTQAGVQRVGLPASLQVGTTVPGFGFGLGYHVLRLHDRTAGLSRWRHGPRLFVQVTNEAAPRPIGGSRVAFNAVQFSFQRLVSDRGPDEEPWQFEVTLVGWSF